MEYKGEVEKIVDEVLQAKTKGNWRLEKKRTYQTPYITAFVPIGLPEARVSQLPGVVDDIENVLAFNGHYISVTYRTGPARFEIETPNPPIAYLRDAWPTVLAQPVNEFLYNAFFRYQATKRLDMYPSIKDAKNAHTLFTGSTGSGKSVCALSALTTLLMLNSPDVLSVIICDPNGTGFTSLDGCPHIVRTAIDNEDIVEAIQGVHGEMTRRRSLRDKSVANKRILIVIDELNDQIDDNPDVVPLLAAIARRGRGLGINIFAIGQKMSAGIPTGIQTNLTARITGRMNSADDAARTSGEGSQAHKLPVSRGSFEFRNGPPIGGQEIVSVQSYMVEPERALWYTQQICERWRGIEPHYRPGNSGPTEDEDERLAGVRAMLRASGDATPHDVCKHHEITTGKQLNFYTAKKLLESAKGKMM